jgi:hypothetical protein
MMMVFNKQRVLLVSLLEVAAAACSSPQRTGQSRAPTDQSRACSSPIVGAKQALAPGPLLLLGELHGTAEIPRFVGDLACEASVGGSRVQLGLEIPSQEQSRINLFLASSGSAPDHQVLIESEFWRRPVQDGRSSRAVVELLDSIRRLKASGAKIDVFLFDEAGRVQDRDAEMAKKILAVHGRAPGDFFLILTGNVHAMKKKIAVGTTELVPMGLDLVEAGAPVTSLASAYPPGTAWVCMGSGSDACGSHEMRGKHRGDARFIELTGSDERYDGIFYVPSLTSSPPAAADH